MCDIVIAHYNEDLEWLKNIKSMASSVQVYSKSTNPPKDSIPLPNIGRESHTYLYHIVDNYDTICANPNKVTMFLQGRISDHIKYYKSNTEEDFVLKLFLTAKLNGKSTVYEWINVGFYAPRWSFRVHRQKHVKPCHESFGPWFVRYVQPDFPFHQIKWYVGALFAIRNDVIAKRDKEYYIRLLEQHDHINQELCHYLERAWWYVFPCSESTDIPKPSNKALL